MAKPEFGSCTYPKMGSAGNLPAPLGDSPSGMGDAPGCSGHVVSGKAFGLVPSGRLPDGTGESPVLPPLIGYPAVGAKGATLSVRAEAVPRLKGAVTAQRAVPTDFGCRTEFFAL